MSWFAPNDPSQFGGGFGGWPQMGGYGMGGGYQPQAPSGADQGNARIDKLRNRVNNLQEQWKGADTTQQAEIQGRMDQMQGRIKGLRKDRRRGEGMFAQPQPATGGGQQQNGMAQYFGQLPPGFGQGGGGGYGVGGMGMGGGMPQFGGMNFGGMPWGAPNMGGQRSWMQPQMNGGGYDPNANQTGAMPTGANRPGMQYRQDRRQAQRQGGPEQGQMPPQGPQQGGGLVDANGRPSWYEAGTFNTPFGNLVQSSVGNGNIYKKNGTDGQDLYHYDPQAGWKHMTQQEYLGYNNPADFYQDPNQYAAQAGGMQNQSVFKNGMWQTAPGTGTYA